MGCPVGAVGVAVPTGVSAEPPQGSAVDQGSAMVSIWQDASDFFLGKLEPKIKMSRRQKW